MRRSESHLAISQPPLRLRFPSLGLASGVRWASQVLDVSLRACHALRPRRSLQRLAFSGAFVLASTTRTVSPSASYSLRGSIASQAAQKPVTACTVPCVRLRCVVHLIFPHLLPWVPSQRQHSVRVVGYSLPGEDLHLTRNAKLAWRTRVRVRVRKYISPENMILFP